MHIYTEAYQQVTSTSTLQRLVFEAGAPVPSMVQLAPLKWYQLVHEFDCLFSMQNFMCFLYLESNRQQVQVMEKFLMK